MAISIAKTTIAVAINNNNCSIKSINIGIVRIFVEKIVKKMMMMVLWRMLTTTITTTTIDINLFIDLIMTMIALVMFR
ncbi:hypothetical protein QR98_0099570 [Sarcoptes scabiei]|uniref:Uncharacterized protein n=1 Tax=Sarcoptes scabiei TaxID=52283 RepID=A0A132AK73_SARSC|nr:hypothetical protein QR98_0099570 [Sarcoptes scabiei]